MALTPEERNKADETRVLIQDTLISVSAIMSNTIKDAIVDIADGVNATVADKLSKDLTRTFTALAKATDSSANNTFKIQQGLLTSRDINKQLLGLEEKRLSLQRLKDRAVRQELKVDEEALQAAQEAIEAEEELLLKEKATTGQIESKIGLTGKLAGAIAKIPGLGKLIDAKEIDQGLRAAAAQAIALNKPISTTGLMMKGLGMAAKQIGKGLSDPLTVLTKIFSSFLEVNKASVEFQRLTGQNAVAVGSLNTRFATTVDFLKTASELTQQIGFNAISIFGPGQLSAIAEAKNLLGLSAEEAGNLALQSKLSANTVDSFQDNMLSAVDATNRLTKSAVAPGVILKDVLNTSKGISLSLGNNPERLGKAATAARAFGMELKQVDSIANSLLNFESSIEAELEAQLLTGKNINLAKARELALTNDLEGLSAELAKNGATAAEFAGMNRIAQEALAKAVGMSRDDLAKSIMLQESSKNLSDEQRAAVLGVTKEQLQQVDIQERLNTSIDKLAQAFAPVLELLVPVVDLMGTILNTATLITYPIKLLSDGLKTINESLAGAVTFYGAILTSIVYSNREKLRGIGLTIKEAAAERVKAGFSLGGAIGGIFNSFSKIPFGIGLALAAGAVAGMVGLYKAVTVGDLNSPADGKTVVSTKEGGLFELSPNDDLIAAPGASAAIQSAQSGEGGITTISMQPLIAEIQSMKQELKAVLTTIANKEGVIQMDSDIVGKALVLGSVRV